MLARCQRRCYGPLRLRIGHANSRAAVGTDCQPMVPSNDLLPHPAKLRQRLDTDGYLYFSRLVPRELIAKAAVDLESQLLANNWTSADLIRREEQRHGVAWGIPAPEQLPLGPGGAPEMPAGFAVTDAIRAAAVGSNVMAAARTVLGGGVYLLPKYSLDLSYPDEEHGFRTPSVYLQKGTKLTLCAWVPLLDVPLRGGGLVVAAGSNTAASYDKIRTTYGVHDVESAGIRGDGSFTDDVDEVLKLGCPLHTTSFEAGDIVLTTIYTMQAFVVNESRHWRLSASSRWTMEGDDVGPDPRFDVGGDALSRWERTRDDPKLFPRTMEQAKADWGLRDPVPSTPHR